MKKCIKFAVLGCGHIGRRHAEIIKQTSDCELVALIDTKPEEALSLEQLNIPFFSSLDSFLKKRIETDVVVIATPNGLHAEQAIKCLEACKHVLIEKPLTITSNSAQAIIAKAESMGRYVFTVMQNRYSPPSAWLKNIIEKAILGNIYIVQVNCYWNRDDRYYVKDSWHGSADLDGGVLFTQFSHFIDIMYWLFGDIKNTQGVKADFNHKNLTEFDDSGIVNFEFLNGGIGSINYSTSAWQSNVESSMTIIAENGTIKIGGQYMDKVEYCHIKDYVMPALTNTNAQNDYGLYKGSAANHHYVIENIIDVLNGNSKVNATAEEGLKVVNIIERIYTSSKHINQ